jgi:hypothetical protein
MSRFLPTFAALPQSVAGTWLVNFTAVAVVAEVSVWRFFARALPVGFTRVLTLSWSTALLVVMLWLFNRSCQQTGVFRSVEFKA